MKPISIQDLLKWAFTLSLESRRWRRRIVLGSLALYRTDGRAGHDD